MRCPKCNGNIDDNMLVCPNCKKVLKLVCPECNTINKTNTCKKCGFVIITKCHKCGKINQTKQGSCSKCGFSTYTSVAINASNIDEFACLTVEFPNLEQIKTVLGSTKLYEKFKINLDNLILDYTKSIGLTRQIVSSGYIIRFNKDETFEVSANKAMQAAIEIQNLITELNFKLDKLKNFAIRCNIAVLKRDIYSKPGEYKSGLDIKLVYQNTKKVKLLNNLQVITDASVYEAVCDNFSLSNLTSFFVKNEFVMFFELNLKKYVKIPVEEVKDEKDEELIKLPDFSELGVDNFEEEDDIYNIEAINFDAIKCDFISTKSVNLIPQIISKIKEKKKNIISVKCDKKYAPKTAELITEIENTKAFTKIFRVTCYDEMKYKPYGFFHELISNIYNFSKSTKNFAQNDFSMFKEIDSSGFIKDLINLNKREFPHPEDVRYSLFELFFNIFYSMQNALIYVENIEKMDDTSYEVLQMIFDKFDNLDVSYLMLGSKEFSMQKKSYFLLTQKYFTEITLKSTPFAEIIKKDLKKLTPVLDSYYMQKIAQNAKGSPIYFQQAIEFLKEKGLLQLEDKVYSVAKFENVLIPPSLDELVIKRLQNLSKDSNAFKLLGMILLIAPSVDFSTLSLLNVADEKIIQKLVEQGYIYIYRNTIYVQNYNLYRENFLASTPLEQKQALAKELLEKLFKAPNACPCEAILYNILEQEKNEFIVWEKLSQLNTSMGDFSAYLNCSVKFLKLINNHIDEGSQKTIEDYKMEVYENISNLLYKYTPEKIQNIAQIILDSLEKSTDDKKVINLCNKMLQGCLISGDYSHALRLIHKILSKFPNASINPSDKSFDIAFFLISLIKIEVLFSIGDLKDCIESGDEILSVINTQNLSMLKPEHLSQGQFMEVITDAMSFVAFSRIILLKDDLKEFVSKIHSHLGTVPKIFDLFFMLEKVMHGKTVAADDIEADDDKFSKIVSSFVKAFSHRDDCATFASDIYQAKISTKLHKLYQFELVCDLLIGHSYFRLKEFKKAASIYHSVLEQSAKNGLKTVTYLAWYFISLLKFEQGDFEVAYGVANNASIQLEKDSNSSEFLLLLFKSLLSKILIEKDEKKSAQLCFNHAIFIKDKYGLEIQVESPPK